MPRITLKVNGEDYTLDVPSDMALLWALRENLNMTDTMFNCGMGVCGTCTVKVDGKPRLSCQTKAVDVDGQSITTINGLGTVINVGSGSHSGT